MKKKKILASLVLSAMMVGTLGTSVSAATWKPDNTSGVSSTGGSGGTTGSGIVQYDRVEKLFLVAVPTTARQYRFYADPTGNTLTSGKTFQFQNEEQKWVENPQYQEERDNGTKVPQTLTEIQKGDADISNFVAVYNAGSVDVTVNVDARLSFSSAENGMTIEDENGVLGVRVVAKRLEATDRQAATPFAVNTDTFTRALATDSADYRNTIKKKGGAVQSLKTSTLWEIDLPAAEVGSNVDAGEAVWITKEDTLSSTGQKVTKDVAVSLEDYNAQHIDEKKLTEYKYPVALFALTGYATDRDDDFWKQDILARLVVKWDIRNNATKDTAPTVDPVVTITDLKDGNFVPVSLGSGDKGMNTVSSVQWVVDPGQDSSNPAGFRQELLGTQVTYQPLTATTGNLVFDQMALMTLNRYEAYNGSKIVVTFSAPGKADVQKTFQLWVY